MSTGTPVQQKKITGSVETLRILYIAIQPLFIMSAGALLDSAGYAAVIGVDFGISLCILVAIAVGVLQALNYKHLPETLVGMLAIFIPAVFPFVAAYFGYDSAAELGIISSALVLVIGVVPTYMIWMTLYILFDPMSKYQSVYHKIYHLFLQSIFALSAAGILYQMIDWLFRVSSSNDEPPYILLGIIVVAALELFIVNTVRLLRSSNWRKKA